MSNQLDLDIVLYVLDIISKNPEGIYRLYDTLIDDKTQDGQLFSLLPRLEQAGYIKCVLEHGVNGVKLRISPDVFRLLQNALSAQQGLVAPATANPSSQSPNNDSN